MPSVALKFTIDPTTLAASGADGENRAFAEYLTDKCLYVDVWDGDSLLQLGTMAVELRSLLRQGEPVVRSTMEYDVVGMTDRGSMVVGGDAGGMGVRRATGKGAMSDGTAPTEVRPGGLPSGNVVGRVQLLMSNLGLEGDGDPLQSGANDWAGGTTGLAASYGGRMDAATMAATDRDWRVGAPGAGPNLSASTPGPRVVMAQRRTGGRGGGRLTMSSHQPRHRARARPLASTSTELAALLQTHQEHTSQIHRDQRDQRHYERVRRWRRTHGDGGMEGDLEDSAFDPRAESDPSSLSAAELQALVRRFGRAKGDGRSTVVDYKEFLSFSGVEDGAAELKVLEDKLRKILKKAEAEGIRLEESFEHFDKDGNGFVDRGEFETALRELHFKPSKAELKMLMKRFDNDGNGEIEYGEFIKFARSGSSGSGGGGGNLSALESKLRKILKKAEAEGIRLEESFEHFDKDGNGTVDRSEFETALRELHFKPSQSELSMLMKRFDNDGNGEIQYGEFIKFARDGGGSGGGGGGGDLASLESKLRKILKKAEAEGIQLEESFEHFDKDGNGFVDRGEFETALRELHFKPSKAELKMLMKRFDNDGNGEIEYGEFIKFARGGGRGGRSAASAAGSDWDRGVDMDAVKAKCRLAVVKCVNSGIAVDQIFSTFDKMSGGEDGDGITKPNARSGRAQITGTEFRYALMEMGLALMAEGAMVPGGKGFSRDTQAQAAVVNRQYQRMRNVYKGGRGGRAGGDPDAIREAEGADDDLEMQMRSQELETVRLFRESRKKLLVSKLLKSNMSAELTIYPSFGQVVFFEMPLTIPYVS